MTYTCWQCRKQFKRKKDEWFCGKCMQDRQEIVVARPQFKGGGFYSTN